MFPPGRTGVHRTSTLHAFVGVAPSSYRPGRWCRLRRIAGRCEFCRRGCYSC
ncbi:unnamed protein product [Symbiodinium sp. CCMP2456]|nr:unnamed protein product [Symbiodinium sp. CCMP2456]